MAERLEVKIGEKSYPTVIDNEGVQRFPENRLYKYLTETKQIDLNLLCVAYQEGRFSKDEYMEFYMGLGYSVCMFSTIFDDVEIKNPLWNQKDNS